MTGAIDPGRLEAVLAMADALETTEERRAVVSGYYWSGYPALARDAQAAWSAVTVAEYIVIRQWDRIRHGTTFTWRDGEEL